MSANLAKDPNRRPDGRQLVLAAQNLPAARDPYGMLAGYPETGTETPGQSYLDLILELWRIVYKRKWLILSIAAAFLTIGTLRTLMKDPALYGDGSPSNRSQRRQDRQHRGCNAVRRCRLRLHADAI